jgi:hypothetical protein
VSFTGGILVSPLSTGHARLPELHGAPEALRQVWSEHSSREDAFDFVRETGLQDRGYPWGQHIRFSRIYPLLGEIKEQQLGDQEEDYEEAPSESDA